MTFDINFKQDNRTMRCLLALFLFFTFGTIYGESSQKSFNWGLADQNPGKQFVVDEKIWGERLQIC